MIVEYYNDEAYVIDIIAGEDINYEGYPFQKGDKINIEGSYSLIRSEDVEIEYLDSDGAIISIVKVV